MTTRSLIPVLAVLALPFTAACELIEEETPDTGNSDDTGEEEEVPPEMSAVRFINVNPDIQATMKVDIGDDGTIDAQTELYFSQGTDFMEIPAGNGRVTVEDENGAVLVDTPNFPFGKDQKYTVAPTNQPGAWIKLYQPDDIGDDDTRVNLRNAYQGDEIDTWIGYWNGSGYTVDYSFSFGANGEWIEDLPYHNAAVQLEQTYPDQDDLIVDWEFAAVVQVDPGSVMDVYTLLSGDCSYLSSTCSPQLVAHQADGSTFTVNGSHGWAVPPVDEDGDGSYDNEDCDDDDPTVFPGADEICDGLDNDCDGQLGQAAAYEVNDLNAVSTVNDVEPTLVSAIITPDNDMTLDSFEIYVGMTNTAADAEFSLLKQESDGSWTRIDTQTATVSSTIDFHGPDGLGWELDGGTTYALGMIFEGDFSYTFSDQIDDPSWGTFTGYLLWEGALVPATLPADTPSGPGVMIGFRITGEC